ncbi:MAG: M20/M25/M40 family metallo-hydrolase [candidate division KSB1 bacterium]|nr:M20/M25/M40 family metallo-hydrolase [candidate division KSB1 bacterium]MDZ7334347.1 M20/M25/M40 family metallo-hydrolase [candidate division KSB1 bacterium]MDZ7356388.1 M20/M25/M40 family metallo-hydrolase [candidate division KSB1 bacterium]MDZ7376006.1 M20/M25/M40 family metallo-hydrolase [candidate division KSB1 bacterium]MDZ7399304.1 M20/M25/M40 family metallo-hydrolase [candidate division KSB1 bacterium]
MLKKIYALVIIIFLLQVCFVNSLSQTSNQVLVLIDHPDFKLIGQIPELKVYHFDDDYLIGEIGSGDLFKLNQLRANYQIFDSQGWSGDYYVLKAIQDMDEKIARFKIRAMMKIDATKAIIKIENSEAPQFAAAGFGLEKISRTIKPVPRYSAKAIPMPTQTDSSILKILAQISADSLAAAVQRLQDFKTRYTYSDSIISAAQWIYNRYKSYGYSDVKFDTFYINNRPHRNVIATKPGLVYPDSVIMLGGHYDSIVNGSGTNPYVFAPGADDNASGTVAAMEAARVLAKSEFAATIKFAAWDAEEIGLVGSDAYAHQAFTNNQSIGLYMNFDMVANVSPKYNVTIYADNATMPLAELTSQMARLYTSLQPSLPGNTGGSDHRSFQLRGYRAYFVQEGVFSPHWHKTSDVTQNMDFNYMQQVVQMGVATAMYLAGPADFIHQRPLVKFLSAQFDDDAAGSSDGNGNGYLDAGEKIELFLTAKNFGDSTAHQVRAVLSSDDPYVSIITREGFFGSVVSQGTANNTYPFLILVASNCPSGHKIWFNLQFSDDSGNRWEDQFNLLVKMPELIFERQDFKIVSGNSDDKIDPGELIALFLALKNNGLRTASDIIATLRCGHPSIAIIDSVASFADISISSIGTNDADHLLIKVLPDARPEIISFSLNVSEGQGFYRTSIGFKLAIGQSKILLVEDDGRFDFSQYYKNAFDVLGIPYYHWDTQLRGMMMEDTLRRYERVVWYTGMESRPSLSVFGTKLLEHYLEQGGRLFINGALFPFSVRDSLILSQFLHSRYVSFDTRLSHLRTSGANSVLGELDFWLAKSGENYQSLRGEIDVSSPAEPILFYDLTTSSGKGNIKSSGVAGVAVAENNYRAVMFAFGWEAIENAEMRANIMASILNWLGGSATSIDFGPFVQHPIEHQLAQNFPNPFNTSTTILFHLSQPSEVRLTIYDLLGREIKMLAKGKFDKGEHKVIWQGDDEISQPVASGIYLVRMSAGNTSITRKIVLLK